MERAFSVEDFMGSFIKMGAAGFSRTDSESAFQEWLKRIPSHSNLSDKLDIPQGLQMLGQYQAAHQYQNLQNGSQGPSTLQAPEGLSVGTSPMPRVPSLDLLRQLVAQTSNANPGSAIPVSAAGVGPVRGHLGSCQSLAKLVGFAEPRVDAWCSAEGTLQHDDDVPSPRMDAVATGPLLPPMVPLPPTTVSLPLPVASHHKAAVTAAQQLNMQHMQTTSGSDIQLDKATMSKAEYRRARRMLSNRESARRSRRRKQEHLLTLEEQMAKVQEEKQVVEDRAAKLERELDKRDNENRRLREEVAYLRDHLEKIPGGADVQPFKAKDPPRKAPRTSLGDHPSRKGTGNGRRDADGKLIKREHGANGKMGSPSDSMAM